MKKIIITVLLLVTSFSAVFSQSYMNNEYQMKARDYANKADKAFNLGEYDMAVEYSKLAEENAYKSEIYITDKVAQYEANSRMIFAKNRFLYAKNIDAQTNFPEEYVIAEENIASADLAYSMTNWETAKLFAETAIDALETVTEVGEYPMYYVVDEWSETKDCFWNISGNPAVYNNPWMWEKLYEANKSIMPDPNDPHLITPGMKLFIPTVGDEVRTGDYSNTKDYEPFGE